MRLSSAQVASIAELVDESPEQVRDRLQEEPALAPLVLNAVEARQARKRAGRTMAIVGFTILGIAETVGLILVIGSYRTDSSGIHADWSQYAAGLGIELGGLGIGLPIGIPGIVKLAKPTDVEKAAVHEYRGPDPSTPESPSGPPPPSEGTVMMLPLVSLSF